MLSVTLKELERSAAQVGKSADRKAISYAHQKSPLDGRMTRRIANIKRHPEKRIFTAKHGDDSIML